MRGVQVTLGTLNKTVSRSAPGRSAHTNMFFRGPRYFGQPSGIARHDGGVLRRSPLAGRLLARDVSIGAVPITVRNGNLSEALCLD